MKNRFCLHISLFSFIIILDQASKYLIRTLFIDRASMIIIENVLSFTFTKNTGVSFGLFKGFNSIFALIAVLALALFLYFYKTEKNRRLQYLIILAGITGNLIDRLTLGYVVDFINFHIWPIFNIADSAIFIGIFWLAFNMIREEYASKSAKAAISKKSRKR